MDDANNRVVIGMDPHERSVTIEVMTCNETILGGGRYAPDEAGFAAMRRYVSQSPDHVWAIEGCSRIGHHVAVRLLAAGRKSSMCHRCCRPGRVRTSSTRPCSTMRSPKP